MKRIAIVAVICGLVGLLLYSFVWHGQTKHDPVVAYHRISREQLKNCMVLHEKLNKLLDNLTVENLSSTQDALVRMTQDIVSCAGRQAGPDGEDVTTGDVRYLRKRLDSMQKRVGQAFRPFRFGQ